jgi:hypothetical protein
MTHWRNGGKTVGGLDQSSRLHNGADTRADSIRSAGATPPRVQQDSGRLTAAPLFIDDADREFAAYLLTIVLVGFPLLFVGAVYLLLVS